MDSPCNKDLALKTNIKAIPNATLSSRQRKSLCSLRTRTNIVIKSADKGSAWVIMFRDDYLVKVMDHLENNNFYQRVDEEPTKQFAEEITLFLQNLMGRRVINEETLKYFWPQDYRSSIFYILPKIHKESTSERPTVS